MKRSGAITIIGAGPAGLTAAINLALAGHRVVVHEQHSEVGRRFHGDFQGLENWSSQEDALNALRTMGIQPEFYCRPVTTAYAYGPHTSAKFVSQLPWFYLLTRGNGYDSLDSSLKRQALGAGVEIKFNSHVDHRDGDILATGPKLARVIAVGVVFETDIPDTTMVLLDNTLAPKGYSYLLAADGKATLGATLFDQFQKGKISLERSVTRFREILSLEVKNPVNFTGYGTLWHPRSISERNQIYVGEAAGFQDNLFGFGIRYAITTGYLAARSLIEGSDYNTLWRRRLGNQLRTSLVNRLSFELLGHPGYDYIVSQTRRCKDPRELWMKFYNMSMCRPCLYPVARLFSSLKNRHLRA